MVLFSPLRVYVPCFPPRINHEVSTTPAPFSPQGCPLNNGAIGSLLIEVGKVTAQSCLWGLACPTCDDSVPSQCSPLRCLCSSDLLSLSHTVWTAGRLINEDRASNGAAPWASVGCFQSSLLDQCGSRWLYCVLTMAPLQGLCSVLLSSWGGHRQPCSTGSRLRGGPCWHLIQVGGRGEGLRKGTACRFPTYSQVTSYSLSPIGWTVGLLLFHV